MKRIGRKMSFVDFPSDFEFDKVDMAKHFPIHLLIQLPLFQRCRYATPDIRKIHAFRKIHAILFIHTICVSEIHLLISCLILDLIRLIWPNTFQFTWSSTWFHTWSFTWQFTWPFPWPSKYQYISSPTSSVLVKFIFLFPV